MDFLLRAFDNMLKTFTTIEERWSRRPYKIFAELFMWAMLLFTAIFFIVLLYPLVAGNLDANSTAFKTWLIVEIMLGVGIVVVYPMLIRQIRADRHAHQLSLARQAWHPVHGR